ncbi:ribosome assembly factor SBDS [Saccharolobus islandicus]|uniref:Shwachman-Bodian-Diamond syndrome protein n=6 Tax=Saccharolobus islandicus TaxID=43080 RepID=F0NF59_SACI5|nr:ribosome assembly factor SBDS [Sulfolobus islandicus]ACP38157.1 Shwachman-Bodian-Diamond syndrome protein [Sulfolobus islandicus M.14.25]ACP55336.1 Shwachman-Bodian-Diamond syndrome protein [Sulfolobus islandicus M.16.27]ACR42004.1 Shwachman-Bodian-Diamond syndrome protein [Sulfolobus islandicus M.16.4]ADX82699.1 putative RNA-associated protein [Sulfolobus islandicus HVE10/4]ADX85339.1 Shwachman-Bodian-Diamond syndrome protein [Sulfolobus islandicus REY15A]
MTKERDYVVVKYDSHGERFEILAKPKEALAFRSGKSISLSDVVVSDTIYKDVKKGLKASPASLKKVFGTTDFETIVKEILLKGELPVTAEQRKEMLETKRKQIIDFIHRNAVDPKTNLPIPPTRLEMAMEQARIQIDLNKDVEAQAMQIVKEISKIIPIKIARALLSIKVPSEYSSKVRSQLHNLGEVKKANWLEDGTLLAELEIPAGAQQDVIDKLNNLTKGEVEVKVLQVR